MIFADSTLSNLGERNLFQKASSCMICVFLVLAVFSNLRVSLSDSSIQPLVMGRAVDLYHGLYQNETGSDGIGDIPYIIDENNTDWYPLMRPLSPLLGDINSDGVVGLSDLVLLAQAYGSIPEDSNWNPYADFDHNFIIELTDLVILANRYGQHYP
jgi:hypothetical protein